MFALGLTWGIRGTCLSKTELGVFAFFATAIGVSTGFSRHPYPSFESCLFLFFGLSLCLLVADSLRTSTIITDEERLLKAARILGSVFSLPLLAGILGWWAYLAEIAPRNGGIGNVFYSPILFRNPQPFGHWNYTGGYALLILPILIALALRDKSKWRPIWWFPVALATLMLFSASSRGALLGSIAALFSLFAIGLYTGILRSQKAVLAAILISFVGLILAATNPRVRALVLSPSSFFQPNEGDVQRLAMANGGVLLFQKRPWIGHGPGMTPFIYPSVRAKLSGGVETAFQLHSTPLQMGVDLGIFGLLGILLLAGLLFRKMKFWFDAPPSTARFFALTASVTLVGYGVMSLTDYQLNVVAITSVSSLLAGLLLAGPAPHAISRPARQSSLLVAAFALLASVSLVPSWRARASYWSAWGENAVTPDISALEKAVDFSPRNTFYLNQLAIHMAEATSAAESPKEKSTLQEKARSLLMRSLEIDPMQEPAITSLAWLFLPNNPSQAERFFRRSLQLIPDRDTLHFGLSLSLLAQNKKEAAANQLALECLVNPSFLASPLWEQQPFLSIRPICIKRLIACYQFCINHPSASEWQKCQLKNAQAFTLWWIGQGPVPASDMLQGATSNQKEFFTWLSKPGAVFPNSNAAWIELERARRSPTHADEILQSSRLQFDKIAVDGAVARLHREQDSIAALLKSPAPDQIGVVQQKINREHYAVIFGYLDGPGYDDLAPRISDAFTQTFAGPLFPPRSNVPGPILDQLQSAP